MQQRVEHQLLLSGVRDVAIQLFAMLLVHGVVAADDVLGKHGALGFGSTRTGAIENNGNQRESNLLKW